KTKRTGKIQQTIGMILMVLFLSQAGFALTGKEIMEKNDALPKGKSFTRDSVLLVVKGKRKEKKVFRVIQKKYGEKTRMRLSFSEPTHLEFLVWSEPGKDSLQWIKLSSGKKRKIASSDKGKPWMNSHFYYEDISERYFSDYSYELKGEAEVNGTACYKVERTKIKGTPDYSRVTVYVGKEDFVTRKVEFYEKGRHSKTLTMYKIEKISGVYTTRKAVMERTDGKGKSIMYIRSIQYDVPVSDNKLKREGF
ncbi:MAG: outer membrane lipoprotein-sorting protein, partial [bacterium]|nr:outer membrane lipoprotein-sorting protein [bacterium]